MRHNPVIFGTLRVHPVKIRIQLEMIPYEVRHTMENSLLLMEVPLNETVVLYLSKVLEVWEV
jgi:hypothetical protein